MEMIKGKHLKFDLMPAKSGTCPECGYFHQPEEPHNKGILFYQYSFYNEHGCWPTWEDAIAHCSQETKEKWIKALNELGERIGREAE